jgi:flavin reductase (DIM6/NTAB) family NADH-FMN oxidoreductase RutF
MVIGADDFRRVLGHFASGVTIITTCDDAARPTGLTASAFTSVSLEPPLVLVCVDHKAQCYSALRDGGRFAVNVLGLDQEVVSRRFATTKIVDKFDGVPYRLSERKLPLIDGALAHLQCVTVAAHVEGDHTILVGRVEHADANDGEPLVYYRGRYCHLSRAQP